jgi:UDP-N-acetylmuramoyl-tripeptide--D-alanyl-D-alanine ligase
VVKNKYGRKRIYLLFLQKVKMQIEDLYRIFLAFPNISTDSRSVKKDDLFFALKGPSFNGNQFAAGAIAAGASYVIIDEAGFHTGEKTILVKDVLSTLQELARFHRRQFKIPFIAITGSNGKTTSKELVAAVLSARYQTYTTVGNLNNHIGIPLTILRVQPDAEIAVIEMGANHLREIAGYCIYTMPTHGVITNCGKAHLEGFGGLEGVRKGKGELYDYLRENDGTVFQMKDDDYLQTMGSGIAKKFTYGTADADCTGFVIENKPFLKVKIATGNFEIQSRLVGAYNLPNVLLAVAIGQYFDVQTKNIIAAIENYEPSNSRSQLIEKNSNKIILDAYNANPSSMKLAIENMAQLAGIKKVLILGAMAELGSESLAEHQAIADYIGLFEWEQVLLVGGDFLKIRHPFLSFSNAAEAAKWLQERKLQHCYILIKGSRSAGMEKVLGD